MLQYYREGLVYGREARNWFQFVRVVGVGMQLTICVVLGKALTNCKHIS